MCIPLLEVISVRTDIHKVFRHDAIVHILHFIYDHIPQFPNPPSCPHSLFLLSSLCFSEWLPSCRAYTSVQRDT